MRPATQLRHTSAEILHGKRRAVSWVPPMVIRVAVEMVEVMVFWQHMPQASPSRRRFIGQCSVGQQVRVASELGTLAFVIIKPTPSLVEHMYPVSEPPQAEHAELTVPVVAALFVEMRREPGYEEPHFPPFPPRRDLRIRVTTVTVGSPSYRL